MIASGFLRRLRVVQTSDQGADGHALDHQDVLRQVDFHDRVRGVVALGPQLDVSIVDPGEPFQGHVVAESGDYDLTGLGLWCSLDGDDVSVLYDAFHAVPAHGQEVVRSRSELLGDCPGHPLDGVRVAHDRRPRGDLRESADERDVVLEDQDAPVFLRQDLDPAVSGEGLQMSDDRRGVGEPESVGDLCSRRRHAAASDVVLDPVQNLLLSIRGVLHGAHSSRRSSTEVHANCLRLSAFLCVICGGPITVYKKGEEKVEQAPVVEV